MVAGLGEGGGSVLNRRLGSCAARFIEIRTHLFKIRSLFYKFVSGHFAEPIVFVSYELEEVVVEGPDSGSVTDGDQGDALGLHVVVQVLLNVDGDGTSAFIQDSVLGLVVKKAGHGDTLFFTSGEHIVPVVLRVPSTFALDQLAESHVFKENHEVIVSHLLGLHLLEGVRVDQLISESTVREVGSLGNVEDLVSSRLMDYTSSSRPEFTKNSEERTLTATVGASDHQVHARLDLKAHLSNKGVSVGGNDRHVSEHNVFGPDESSLSLEVLEADDLFALLLLTRAISRLVSRDHDTLVSTDFKVLEYIIHLVDERGVTSEGLDFLVRDNESTDGFGQVD